MDGIKCSCSPTWSKTINDDVHEMDKVAESVGYEYQGTRGVHKGPQGGQGGSFTNNIESICFGSTVRLFATDLGTHNSIPYRNPNSIPE
jgi:hypothetical protein